MHGQAPCRHETSIALLVPTPSPWHAHCRREPSHVALQVHMWSLQKRPEFKEVFGEPGQEPAAQVRPPRGDRHGEPQQQVYLRFKSRAPDSA